MTEALAAREEGAGLLELRSVSKRYGSLVALNDVSLSVRKGDRHALIGPNGAGKSTLFNVIAGVTAVTGGRIMFEGEDVTRLPEHRRVRLGLARTFQRSTLFDRLSARENVAIAVQRRAGIAHKVMPKAAACTAVTERAADLLALVGLAGRSGTRAGELSHGERRQVEVAVALATNPILILMDEPTAGMSGAERSAFLEMVATLSDSLTIVIVEHDMDVVFGLANRVSVLDAGALLADGPPDAIRDSVAVQEAYLGHARPRLLGSS